MRSDVKRAFELLKSGDPDHVPEAIELLQNTVFSFSMTVCGHREDAEDTMQEVLVKAIPYLWKFDNPKALTTWLYTVARNRCWMSRRKSKFAPNEHLSLNELMPGAAELDHLREIAASGASPEQLAIVHQDAAGLLRAILKVPPSYRIVLVLHDVEELSTEEIARILNLKEGSVRVRLHRARLFVRKELASPSFNPESRGKSAADSAPLRSSKCKQIFANLSEYLDGNLDGALCEELERHMSKCAPCEAFLSSLRNMIDRTHALPAKLPSMQAKARVRARLARQFRSLPVPKQ
jgi:RNA polymerase sigma-70 factor (ECF subfamily)